MLWDVPEALQYHQGNVDVDGPQWMNCFCYQVQFSTLLKKNNVPNSVAFLFE